MAIDPQAQFVLDLIIKSGRPPLHTLTPAEARQVYRDTREVLQIPVPDVASVQDRKIPGPNGPIPIRYFRPKGSQAGDVLPVLVYFHGGGWVIGDLDTHDIICRLLGNHAGVAVISVDYRMGPEHKFPAAVEDAFAATRWVADQAGALGLDGSRIAVGGDSAGGNLSAVVTLLARDRGPKLSYQLLIYPGTDMTSDTESLKRFADGYMLTRDGMRWFMGHYLRGPADGEDWRASPLKAPDLSGLPPAHILTAGFDPLMDEGKAYADRLAAAGVPVNYRCYEGMIHGFFGMTGPIETARKAIAEAGLALRRAFAGAAEGRLSSSAAD